MPEAHDDARADEVASAGLPPGPSAKDDLLAVDNALGPTIPKNPIHAKRIKEWSQQHWRHGPCPVCQSNEFVTGDVSEVRMHSPPWGFANLGISMFSIMCKTCGYILWFNAVQANVVRAGENPDGTPRSIP